MASSAGLLISPDGSRAVIVLPGSTLGWLLAVIDTATGRLTTSDAPIDSWSIGKYSWGPDAWHIAMSLGGEIRIIPLVGSAEFTITSCADPLLDVECIDPTSAFGSARIAYTKAFAQSGPMPDQAGIYVGDIECHLPPPTCSMTSRGPVAQSRQYVLSPAGDQLAYTQSTKLTILDLGTSRSTHSFTLPEDPIGMAWSPDGEAIAMGGESGVFLVSPTTGEVLAKSKSGGMQAVSAWVVLKSQIGAP